ncbi:MAG: hypothetical protein SCARUB_00764 [Candidatus Scalindua rubra]|uniref:Uncharacterized protein n=1 Tax=Candidatus Scalindua rubra TaxID=1872076 RepID=A0A1E3XEL7_9BACT|nr:MAG: hypothetical protein SCARUB_00764 [Candidatus Scalindua rubra]
MDFEELRGKIRGGGPAADKAKKEFCDFIEGKVETILKSGEFEYNKPDGYYCQMYLSDGIHTAFKALCDKRKPLKEGYMCYFWSDIKKEYYC